MIAVYDGTMLDINSPAEGVEVIISDAARGTNTIWVNVDGQCRLRICQIERPVSLDVRRMTRRSNDNQDQRS